MKFFLLLFCCSFLAFSQLEAALAAPPVAEEMAADPGSLSLERQAMEARLGRKLKFSERIALGILKRKARKQQRRAQNDGVTDGMAIASFIVGIGSILLAAGGLGFFTAIVGLILGIVSLGRINRNPGFRTGKGFAIAGIAINGGLIFLFLLVISIFLGSFN